jgi:hypothetical protein
MRKFLEALVSRSRDNHAQTTEQVCLFSTRPVLYLGYSHEALQHAIDDVQQILSTQGYLAKRSGKFDEDTKRAVEVFQSQNGLKVDGMVGPLTWAALYYPQLKQGDPSLPEVSLKIAELQCLLQKEGFSIRVDGYLGWETTLVLKKFQNRYGLQADGICGPMTWAVLLGQREAFRQKPPFGFYLSHSELLLIQKQLLMVIFIGLGIQFSPFGAALPLWETLTTAYGLTYIVPMLLERLRIKGFIGKRLPLLQFSPYILAGFLWQPLLEAIKSAAVAIIK